MHKIYYIVGTMKHQTLMYGSILAVGIIAAVICVGMVTGSSVAKPFISVDPISDKNIGDQFAITGTTSLPAGTEILAEVYPASFEDKTGTGSGVFSGATGTITVTGGTGGANTWSFPLDTSTFQPVEYLVNISTFTGDPAKGDFKKGDISGTARLTLLPGSGTAAAGTSAAQDKAAAAGILIDAIHDTTAGDSLVVTGRTSLRAGTELVVKVIPSSTDGAAIANAVMNPEIASGTKVTEGRGTDNRFTVTLDTRNLSPEEHIILVSDVNGDAAGTGGMYTGSALFNIIAAATGTTGNNAAQYITIDPVADKTTGDLLVVSGSTNLPVGTDLIVQIPGSNGGARVRAGTGGVNRFSSAIDTSVIEPGTKSITVTNMIGDVEKGDYRKGDVTASASFTLEGTYLTTDTPVKATITRDDFITLNAIGDRSFGDQFLVTGTTSLPVGTEVMWQVTPASLTTNPNQTGTMTGMMANSQVTKGTGTTDRVSFALDTYELLPEQYNVSVSTVAGDLSKGDFRTGDLTGYVLFTLK
jgi:hypothetical protein